MNQERGLFWFAKYSTVEVTNGPKCRANNEDMVVFHYGILDASFCLLGILLSQLDALQFFCGVEAERMVFPTISDAVLRCQSSQWLATQTVESSVWP